MKLKFQEVEFMAEKEIESSSVCRSWEAGVRRTFPEHLVQRMQEDGTLTEGCTKMLAKEKV